MDWKHLPVGAARASLTAKSYVSNAVIPFSGQQVHFIVWSPLGEHNFNTSVRGVHLKGELCLRVRQSQNTGAEENMRLKFLESCFRPRGPEDF